MTNRFSLAIIVVLFLPLLGFSGKNPADYPLRVHILDQGWKARRLPYYLGTGRGNIEEGGVLHAFDFSYNCLFGLRITPMNQVFVAKWKKPQLTMLLLAPEIGKDEKYDECEVKTTVHEGVYYYRSGEGLSEISQEEFKKRRAERAKAHQQEVSAPVAHSKISIASAPDNAEIEIDGEFAGNTPSVLELDVGEHNIKVRKAGFKVWERKVKLMPGEIKVNAELEAEASK